MRNPADGGLGPNIDRGSRGHPVKEIDDVLIAHPNATNRARDAHLGGWRAAMKIDVAFHGVHRPKSVASWFEPAEPKNAGKNPVSAWPALGEFL